jgi:hypothetical protein
MVVGSKVRMLHGVGEGIVTKVDGNQLVVLLNQGLEIPMRRQDVVEVAARQEEKSMPKEDLSKPPMLRQTSRMFFVKEGVFLAGIAKSAMLVDYSLVNHTDFKLFIVLFQLGRPLNKFLDSFEVEPKSVVQLNDTYPMSETNHLVGLVFQILKFHPDQGDPYPVKEFRLAFSQIDWKKQQNKIPIMEKTGLLIQLDGEIQKIDPEKLKEQLMSHRPVKSETTMAPIRKIESREVDLHIEKLRSDFGELSAGQILDIQLSAFEKEFDRAIRDMVNTLVIIHGVGAGVLKEEIHKRLSKSKQIKHYKEGRKEKFGYGATEIQF